MGSCAGASSPTRSDVTECKFFTESCSPHTMRSSPMNSGCVMCCSNSLKTASITSALPVIEASLMFNSGKGINICLVEGDLVVVSCLFILIASYWGTGHERCITTVSIMAVSTSGIVVFRRRSREALGVTSSARCSASASGDRGKRMNFDCQYLWFMLTEGLPVDSRESIARILFWCLQWPM